MSLGETGPIGGELAPTCPSCRMTIPDDAVFCPYCGNKLKEMPVPPSPPLPPPPQYRPLPSSPTLIDVGRGVAAYSTLILLILLTVNIFILIWSISIVLPGIDDSTFAFYIVTPWIVELIEIGGNVLGAYHILLVIIITASFIWIVWKSWPTFSEELRIRPLKKGHSPLYLVGTFFFTLLAFNFFYYIALEAIGITPETPAFQGDLWKALFAFANASVWEELITRVLFIGIPLIFVDLMRKGEMRWKSYFLGGKFNLDRPEIILILFSSSVFALAHLTSWDAFKIPPTFLAGLVLGYLFLWVGLYASIMLHFAFDYLSIPIEISQDLVVSVVIGIAMLVWIAVGTCYFYYYATKAIGFVMGKELWPPKMLRPKPQPVIYAPTDYYASKAYGQNMAPAPRATWEQSFGFSCKYCGNTEARYKDGDFYCLRCGRRN
jgi:hypothetical protein